MFLLHSEFTESNARTLLLATTARGRLIPALQVGGNAPVSCRRSPTPHRISLTIYLLVILQVCCRTKYAYITRKYLTDGMNF